MINAIQREDCASSAKEKAHAIAFLHRADTIQFFMLIIDLENQFTQENVQYLVTVTDT
jgi:hypothetical protein